MVAGLTTPVNFNRAVDRPAVRYGVPAALLAGAALGWWWSARMANEMSGSETMGMSPESMMSAGAFLVAWLAMMVAMMFPAITPVVKLYARASAQQRVAPLSYFLAGYLAVWMALGAPAYFAWRALAAPLEDGAAWAGRVAGGTFVVAGLWQLTALKELCLRHCRSPMSFFLRYGGRIQRRVGASRMGISHGLFCVGCCWAMFALLVAIGTMNIAWMLILSALIVVEKTFRRGQRVAAFAGVIFLILGMVLVISPRTIDAVT